MVKLTPISVVPAIDLETKKAHVRRHLRCVVCLLLAAMYHSASAQTSGDTLISVGGAWSDFVRSSSGNLTSTSQFGTFTSAGTQAEIHNAATAGIFVSRFLTDHIAVEGVIAWPPTLNAYAQGNATPLGSSGPQLPLGSSQPLASARTWPAMVLLKYAFGASGAAFRPFIGLGVNYTWYSNVKLNETFYQAAQTFAGAGGGVHTSLSPSWNPVVAAGFTYRLRGNWYAMGSVVYLPLKTDANITSVAANGTTTLVNRLHLIADPLVVFASIGYRF